MINKLKPLFASVFIRFLAIGTGLYMSRFLNNPDFVDPKLLKEYNLIAVYNSFLIGLLSLGVPNLIHKFYTNEKNNLNYASFWTTILAFQTILFIIGLFLVVLIFPFTGFKSLILFLGLYSINYILVVDGDFRSICDASGKSWQFSITDLLGKILLACCIFVGTFLPIYPNHLNYFVFCSIILYLSIFFLDWFLQRKYALIGKIDWSIIRKNSKFFLYIGSGFFLSSLYTLTDRLFLDWNNYDKFVINGYSNAYKLIEIAIVIPALITPALASFTKKEVDQLHSKSHFNIFIKWFAATTLIGFFASLGLLLFGNFALLIIDPKKIYYDYASQSLFWLAFSLIFTTISYYISHLLIIFGKEKQGFGATILVGIFTISLYFYLIPRYGHIGAAIATLASMVFDSGLKVWIFLNFKL
jgi:O-antigen/teichoic acid export membrane protein